MKKLLIAAAFSVSSSVGLIFSAQPDGLLHVYFLNVGQGDAILIQTPSGKNILVDGGPGQSVLNELSDTLPFFHRSLDLVISTHPDRDHLEGLIPVTKRYKVGRVLMGGNAKSGFLTNSFLRNLNEKNIPVSFASEDSDIDFGDGAKLDILFPFSPEFWKKEKLNNESIVAKLVFGEHEILLTGDIEAEIEARLIVANVDLDTDILKVAHHGSKTSSTLEFLAAASPKTCVISVGAGNSYHHPHPSAMERLKKYCKEIRRTDLEGRIEMVFGGSDAEN